MSFSLGTKSRLVRSWITRLWIILYLAVSQRANAETEPDILNPGPQLPTFPTNTGTLPQGRSYLEFAPFNYEGGTGKDSGRYYTQFMAHVGATDNVEFRVFGSGWTWGEGKDSHTSFGPLSFSTVVGFWGEQEEYPYLPAFSIEAIVNTEWLGNGDTNNGTNPGVQFAFSKDLFFDTNLNVSLGPMQTRMDIGTDGQHNDQSHWDFLFQWALQKDLIDNELAVFLHGFYNGTAAVSIPIEGGPNSPGLYGISKVVVGGGLIWTVTDRISIYGQISAGANADSPSMVSWSGFAVAF